MCVFRTIAWSAGDARSCAILRLCTDEWSNERRIWRLSPPSYGSKTNRNNNWSFASSPRDGEITKHRLPGYSVTLHLPNKCVSHSNSPNILCAPPPYDDMVFVTCCKTTQVNAFQALGGGVGGVLRAVPAITKSRDKGSCCPGTYVPVLPCFLNDNSQYCHIFGSGWGIFPKYFKTFFRLIDFIWTINPNMETRS